MDKIKGREIQLDKAVIDLYDYNFTANHSRIPTIFLLILLFSFMDKISLIGRNIEIVRLDVMIEVRTLISLFYVCKFSIVLSFCLSTNNKKK
jgi:hypothetical protein